MFIATAWVKGRAQARREVTDVGVGGRQQDAEAAAAYGCVVTEHEFGA